jgi:gluconolactonase
VGAAVVACAWLTAAIGCGSDQPDDHDAPELAPAGNAAAQAIDAGTSPASSMTSDGGRSASGAPAAAGMSGSDAATGAADAATTYPPLEFTQIGAPAVIARGYSLSEGPLWDHCAQRLLFVDVDKSSLFQLQAGIVSTLSTDTGCANGLAFDLHGVLLMAQMGCDKPGKVSRRDRSGTVTLILDKGPMGAAMHTPDDIVVRSDGTIYFTDGDFTHAKHTQSSSVKTTSLPIYRIAPDGSLVQEAEIIGPNGIDLSLDEKTLYVASYFNNQVLRFDVAPDGSLKAATAFVSDATEADSFCLDVQGNMYVGTKQGLLVVGADGTKLGTIPLKSFEATRSVTSCDFGGSDGKTLYVTARSTLAKIEGMPIPGRTWLVNEPLACP